MNPSGVNGLVRHRNSSKQKIMKRAPSEKKKPVDEVLWDEKGYILVSFVPRETTLNSSCYVAGYGGTPRLLLRG